MKNLILIRHAKSSWDNFNSDKQRPLETRGKKDARLVAEHTVKFLPKPYTIVSSDARRAMETATIFAEVYAYSLSQNNFRPELYTFDESRLEQIVRNLDDEQDSVILFGHNEAITNFVNKFGDIFIDNVATSGWVFLQFGAEHWQQIQGAKTLKAIFPRDLK